MLSIKSLSLQNMIKKNSTKKKEPSISPFNKLKNELEKSQKKFVDKEFPSKIESLISRNANQQKKFNWKNLKWLRPQKFFGKKYNIFDKGIDPCDVR